MRIPSLKSFLIFAAGFVSCVAGIVIFTFSAYHLWIKPMQTKMLKRMNSTPPRFFAPHPAEFNFTAVGKGVDPLDFKAYRGRVVVLNVWATWCQPGELSSFAKLAAHYSDDEDVAVVCLSQEPTNTVFKNKEAMSSGSLLYCVGGQRLPAVYKTNGIPATFVIDKNGVIVFEQVGYLDWSHPSVIKLIDSLRKKSNPAPEPSATTP
jgi:thiol-disulfide isomerase/thioredoxin